MLTTINVSVTTSLSESTLKAKTTKNTNTQKASWQLELLTVSVKNNSGPHFEIKGGENIPTIYSKK